WLGCDPPYWLPSCAIVWSSALNSGAIPACCGVEDLHCSNGLGAAGSAEAVGVCGEFKCTEKDMGYLQGRGALEISSRRAPQLRHRHMRTSSHNRARLWFMPAR